MKPYKTNINKSVKISLSLVKRGDKDYVVIKPDDSQSPESKNKSEDWINRIFLKDSPYKTGRTSFSLEDWKKDDGKGKVFVDGIKNSKNIVIWKDLSDDKKIMKGIKALIPAQQAGGIPIQPLGGSEMGSSFGGGFGSNVGLSSMGGDLQASLGSIPDVGSGTPTSDVSLDTAPKEYNSIDIMKNFIQLWEMNKNEI